MFNQYLTFQVSQKEKLTEDNKYNSNKQNNDDKIIESSSYVKRFLERDLFFSRKKTQNSNNNIAYFLRNKEINQKKIEESKRPKSSERKKNLRYLEEQIIVPKTRENFSFIPNKEEKLKENYSIQNQKNNFLSYRPYYANYSSLDPYRNKRKVEAQSKIDYVKKQLNEKEKNELIEINNKIKIENKKKKSRDEVFNKYSEEIIKKTKQTENQEKNKKINNENKSKKVNNQDIYKLQNNISKKKNINEQNYDLKGNVVFKNNNQKEITKKGKDLKYLNIKNNEKKTEKAKLIKDKNIKEENIPYYILSNQKYLFQNSNSYNNLNNKNKENILNLSSSNKKYNSKKIGNVTFNKEIKSARNLSNKRCITNTNENENILNKKFHTIQTNELNSLTPKKIKKYLPSKKENVNYNNNLELLEIRKHLCEFYENKKEIEYTLTDYQKRNLNNNVQKIQIQYHSTIPNEINSNTINTSTNFSEKETKKNTLNFKNNVPFSPLFNKLKYPSNNVKKYKKGSEIPFDNLPKYNFNFEVADLINKKKNEYSNDNNNNYLINHNTIDNSIRDINNQNIKRKN